MNAALIEKWADKVQLINGYGPSECCVTSVVMAHVTSNTQPSNIGWAVGGIAWIVDAYNHNRLVPIGCVGELLIEGPILARHYINDSQKTKESFVEGVPLLREMGRCSWLYKTGDLVRYFEDGSICYVGRKDSQVANSPMKARLPMAVYVTHRLPWKDPVFSLTVHARRTDARPITLCTAGSVLDNGHHARHDGVFRGAFLPLTSTSDPTRKIQLHFSGFPNYGSQPKASANLLERDYLRFETVPSKGDGELVVTHEISLERLFRFSDLRKEAVKVGEKFTMRMNPKRLGSPEGWWTWGSLEGELNGKKFARWERPDREGQIGNLMPGEKTPDVEGMEREGWVFSEPFHELTLKAGEDEAVIMEFVE